mmetsp:Transcript_106114/g.187951  ORF Transcript_106114/g.187951 Transcript_106114/m.187951 type:complete len:296 (+) Transcript_106114:80-967(+)
MAITGLTPDLPINADPNLLVPGATVTTGVLISKVSTSSPNPRRSFEILVRATCNILERPTEVKFQELRKSNATVKDLVANVPACAQLLRRLGFRDCGDVFQLQATGIRPSEVARMQAALHEQPEHADLVRSLAPAIEAVNLGWHGPDGIMHYIPPWNPGGRHPPVVPQPAPPKPAPVSPPPPPQPRTAPQESNRACEECGKRSPGRFGTDGHAGLWYCNDCWRAWDSAQMQAAAVANPQVIAAAERLVASQEEAELQEALRMSMQAAAAEGGATAEMSQEEADLQEALRLSMMDP